MDPETGEPSAEPETGEVLYYPLVDIETGEQEHPKIEPKRPFRIPRQYVSSTNVKPKPFRSSEKRLELITAIIFLMPSMIFFYPVLGIVVCVTEIIMHNWCHNKNKKLANKQMYYRSPLHVIAKEFCADCKAESANVKITKIQDIRNDNRFKKYGLDIRNIVS